jgi:hypothetical protein
MKSHIQILKEIKEEREKFFENYIDYALKLLFLAQ